jgi:uncharacterized protein (DUF488 family)
MFYRRKIILALLELFNGELEKIRLQKLLFLFCQKQSGPDHEFIPYKFGCFSYSAYADLATMVKKGQLSEDANSFVKSEKTKYFSSLKADDKIALQKIKVSYGAMSSNALMKLTYKNYPFWALNSVKAKSLLSEEEMAMVEKSRRFNTNTILYTIGYEGSSLENYLNRLIQNDVKVLVDVRNNPLSMKFGFSKNQLKRYCESIGIGYFHFPDVGIVSSKRQELYAQADYDKLFEEYKIKNLRRTKETQEAILNLLIEHKRIALTCFEAQHCQCHRSHLADAIKTLPGFSYEIKHI